MQPEFTADANYRHYMRIKGMASEGQPQPITPQPITLADIARAYLIGFLAGAIVLYAIMR